jgi:Protein of unknown function (DUF3833)
MITWQKTLLTGVLALSVTSCSVDIKEYEKSSPNFSVSAYFNGNVLAWGMLQDFTNKVSRRFCVEIEGTWQENQGVLAETFYFDDGEISYRNWQLTEKEDGQYQGTAEDVVGTAFGTEHGFAFHWQYDLSVPIDGSEYVFALDDWMYQIDENRVFNRTTMNKLGVAVAEITLFFDKSDPTAQCSNKPNQN